MVFIYKMESLLQKCTNLLTEIELLWLEKYEIPSNVIYASLQKHRINDINMCCKDFHLMDFNSEFLDKLGDYCGQHIAISNNIKYINRTLPPKIIIGGKSI